MRPTDLLHLKPNPAQTKALLAGKVKQRPTPTKPPKHGGEVVALNKLAAVKRLLH